MNRHSNRHAPRRKRKMRSKFWWLTGFCNSHDVSHFAAFFIVVGAKTSVAESVLALFYFFAWLNLQKIIVVGFQFFSNISIEIKLPHEAGKNILKSFNPFDLIYKKNIPLGLNWKMIEKNKFLSTNFQKKVLVGVVMILPQVHLRKPCYDFTFL